jgi:hypothetical protein
MTDRLLVPVDAYLLLERDGKLLMLRRAPGASYAAGLLCPPSGHVEAGETVSAATSTKSPCQASLINSADGSSEPAGQLAEQLVLVVAGPRRMAVRAQQHGGRS